MERLVSSKRRSQDDRFALLVDVQQGLRHATGIPAEAADGAVSRATRCAASQSIRAAASTSASVVNLPTLSRSEQSASCADMPIAVRTCDGPGAADAHALPAAMARSGQF